MKKMLFCLFAVSLFGCAQQGLVSLDKLTTSLSNDEAVWSYSSKQKIIWSVPALPSKAYCLAFYLENKNTKEKGYIYSRLLTKTKGEINYVTNNFISRDGQIRPFINGDYHLSAALFSPDANSDCSFGKEENFISQKGLENIKIKDSDVKSMAKEE